MSTLLLTLGRLPKGLDVARSFAALGWRVLVADPLASHLLGASRAVTKSYVTPAPQADPEGYRDALLRIIACEKVELVIPVSEEIMHVSLLRAQLPAGVRMLSMPPDVLHDVHDKFAFAQRAAGLGLAAPCTALASDPAALGIAAGDDFVVKERHSCGGGGVSFHLRGDAFPQSDGAIVQARAHGDEVSSCSLARDGRVRATAIYRGAVTSGSVAVRFERIEHAAIDDWIARFVRATRWTGFISFDFMVDSAGVPHGLECNPRLTSGVHFFETADLAPAVLDETAPLRLRRERRLQQFWSCLQEAQRALPRVTRFGRELGDLFHCRDVTWSAADPAPLLTMPWTSREILRRAARGRLSLAVAATRDLAWTGHQT